MSSPPKNVLAVTRLRALRLEALTKIVDLERDSVANKSRWRAQTDILS